MRRIFGHKFSKRRKVVLRKAIGETRIVIVGAYKCKRCGALKDVDCTIKNLHPNRQRDAEQSMEVLGSAEHLVGRHVMTEYLKVDAFIDKVLNGGE